MPHSQTQECSAFLVQTLYWKKRTNNNAQEETHSRTPKPVTGREARLSDAGSTSVPAERGWRLTHLTFRFPRRLPENFKSISCHSTHSAQVTQINNLSDKLRSFFHKNFKNQVVVSWGFSKTQHFFHRSKSKKRNLAVYFPRPTTLVCSG